MSSKPNNQQRTPIEFECNDCNGWIILNINTGLRGNFLVVCPNCNREHPRTFEKGEMTQSTSEIRIVHPVDGLKITRMANSAKEKIIPMKSAYSKTRRLQIVEKVRCGFLEDSKMMMLAREKGIIDGYEKYEES